MMWLLGLDEMLVLPRDAMSVLVGAPQLDAVEGGVVAASAQLVLGAHLGSLVPE